MIFVFSRLSIFFAIACSSFVCNADCPPDVHRTTLAELRAVVNNQTSNFGGNPWDLGAPVGGTSGSALGQDRQDVVLTVQPYEKGSASGTFVCRPDGSIVLKSAVIATNEGSTKFGSF